MLAADRSSATIVRSVAGFMTTLSSCGLKTARDGAHNLARRAVAKTEGCQRLGPNGVLPRFGFYNRARRHGHLGGGSPEAFESAS